MSDIVLRKSIGLATGISFCVTVIVGAGILGLPGEAYQLAGADSIYAWVGDFLLSIPMIVIFARMIHRAQTAGGISDFIKSAFGERVLFKSVQAILMITLFVGTAAIAVVGGEYLSSALGGGDVTVALGALSLLFIPTIINYYGIKSSSRIQQIWTVLLLGSLLAVIALTMGHWRGYLSSGAVQWPPRNPSGLWRAMGLLWFAYTGLEMVSFLAEEFHSTKKFTQCLIISLGVVFVVYVGLALAVASTVPSDDPEVRASALVAIARHAIGDKAAALSGYFGYFLILVNLNAAMLGASRFLFSVARSKSGVFPKSFAVINRFETPHKCLLTICAAATLISVGSIASGVGTTGLFTLASQNWFITYLAVIFAFLASEKQLGWRIFGVVTLAICVAFMCTFTLYLAVPIVIAGWFYLRRNAA